MSTNLNRGNPNSCSTCGGFFSGSRRPVIMIGCGHACCSFCVSSRAELSFSSSFNVLLCPACQLSTFLPLPTPLTQEGEEQSGHQSSSVAAPPGLGEQRTAKPPLPEHVLAMLPTAYHLIPELQVQNGVSLCAEHPGLPRGFYCPTHAEACCWKCLEQKHGSGRCFKPCELREAKPILLQGLVHSRRTLESARSRCAEVKAKLVEQQQLTAAAHEAHCDSIVAWSRRCLQVAYNALAEANATHTQRTTDILKRGNAVSEAEQRLEATLRAVDGADSMPAASLVDAMPMLKKSVSMASTVPECTLPPVSFDPILDSDLPPPVTRTTVPKMEVAHGERLLVADQHFNPAASSSSSSSPDADVSTGNSSRSSLVLVDVDSRSVLCKLLQDDEIKTPNGMVEVVTEVDEEVEDDPAARMLRRRAAAERGANHGSGGSGSTSSEDDDTAKGPLRAKNFFAIDTHPSFNAQNSSPAAFRAERQQRQDEREARQQRHSSRRRGAAAAAAAAGGGGGGGVRIVKKLRREFAVCDTLGHRIVLVDAESGEKTREIKQSITDRGSSMNPFTPFGIAVVPVPTTAEEERRRWLEEEQQRQTELEYFEREFGEQHQHHHQQHQRSATDALRNGNMNVESEEDSFGEKERTTSRAGALLVTDVDNHRVHLIDADTGDFVRTWGSFRGSSADEFWSPTACCHIRDALFGVCDTGNHRISILSVAHAGILFSIDLFSPHRIAASSPFASFTSGGAGSAAPSSTAVKSLIDLQRMYPSSICALPENCKSIPDSVDQNLTHEFVEIAVAAKKPPSDRGSDCIILINFSFDLTRVPSAAESDAASNGSAGGYAGGRSMFDHSPAATGQRFRPSHSQQHHHQHVYQPPQPRAGITSPRSAEQERFRHNTMLSKHAISASTGPAPVQYRLSKFRSQPPKTIFEAPISKSQQEQQQKSRQQAQQQKRQQAAATKGEGRLSSFDQDAFSKLGVTGSAGGRYTEPVFSVMDMINQEFGRIESLSEKFAQPNAFAPCTLTVSVMRAPLTAVQRHQLGVARRKEAVASASFSASATSPPHPPHAAPNSSWADNLFQRPDASHSDPTATTLFAKSKLFTSSSALLCIADRVNRCVWTLDPVTGRLFDRVDGRPPKAEQQQQQKEHGGLFFNAPTFVCRISNAVTIAPAIAAEAAKSKLEQLERAADIYASESKQEKLDSGDDAIAAAVTEAEAELLDVPTPDASAVFPAPQQPQQTSAVSSGGHAAASRTTAPIPNQQQQQNQQHQAHPRPQPQIHILQHTPSPKHPRISDSKAASMTATGGGGENEDGAGWTAAAYRERLRQFYSQWNPAKLDGLDNALATFPGPEGEKQLMQILQDKYLKPHQQQQQQPSSSPAAAAAAAVATVAAEPSRTNSTVVEHKNDSTSPPSSSSQVVANGDSIELSPPKQETINSNQPAPSSTSTANSSEEVPLSSSPHPTSAPAPASTAPADYRTQVELIYKQYNSDKLRESGFLDKTMAQWKGKEEELLKNLRKKYNIPGSAASTGGAVASPSASAAASPTASSAPAASAATLGGSTQNSSGDKPPAPAAASPTSSSSTAALPASAPAPASTAPADYRTQVELIYKQYNSDKLKESGFLDKTMAQWKGKEEELLKNLRKKYNIPESAASTGGASTDQREVGETLKPTPPAATPASPSASDYRTQIEQLYEKYNPDKLKESGFLDKTMKEWAGKEDQLVAALTKKYVSAPAKQQQAAKRVAAANAPPGAKPKPAAKK